MAVTASIVHIDRVEGAEIRTGLNGQKIRSALVRVTGLPATVPDTYVLEAAVVGLPADAQLLAMLGSTGLRCRQHLARARASDLIDIKILYTADEFPSGSWLVRDESKTVVVETNMLPGTRHPIRLGWQDPLKPRNKIPEDYAMYKYRAPYRTIIVSGTSVGQPPDAQRNVIRHVNHATFYGYPAGYWLVENYVTETRNQGNTYQVTMQASTWEEHDWSEYSILQSKQTGRFAQVLDSDIDELVALGWLFGWDTRNGVARIEPYHTVNLTSLFGSL